MLIVRPHILKKNIHQNYIIDHLSVTRVIPLYGIVFPKLFMIILRNNKGMSPVSLLMKGNCHGK